MQWLQRGETDEVPAETVWASQDSSQSWGMFCKLCPLVHFMVFVGVCRRSHQCSNTTFCDKVSPTVVDSEVTQWLFTHGFNAFNVSYIYNIQYTYNTLFCFRCEVRPCEPPEAEEVEREACHACCLDVWISLDETRVDSPNELSQ